MDRVSRLHYLLHVYTIGAATPAEREELLDAVRLPENAALVKDGIGKEMDRMGMALEEKDRIKVPEHEQKMEWQLPKERVDHVLSNILRRPMEAAKNPMETVKNPTEPVRNPMEAAKKPMEAVKNPMEAGEPMEATIRPIWPASRSLRKWTTRAAAVLLFLAAGIGTYRLATNHRPSAVATVPPTPQKDIEPGTNKATLTLANGTTIMLDSAHAGPLTRQGGTSIIKLDNGRLAYTKQQKPPNEVLYNKLETPRGGQYQLTLPDGSAVWLNAASSIRYPTAFAGPTREVEITGEAYFEIARNTAMPFIVKAGATQTTVLGTSFNINAYGDENKVITTLLEGAVKFGTQKSAKLLHPGEQGVLQEKTQAAKTQQELTQVANAPQEVTQTVTVQQGDTYQAVAWKNGQFDFDNKTLTVILRQISRWYDVDISNPSINDGTKFGGGISRKLNLSHVLRLLDKNGVHTRLEGKRIFVLP